MNVSCGTDSNPPPSVTWWPTDVIGNRVGGHIRSAIDYYVFPNPNCDQALLEQSSVSVITGCGTYCMYWDQDQYASWSQNWDCGLTRCYLTSGTYYENPDAQQTKGYTYETVIQANDSNGWGASWCDIPVN